MGNSQDPSTGRGVMMNKVCSAYSPLTVCLCSADCYAHLSPNRFRDSCSQLLGCRMEGLGFLATIHIRVRCCIGWRIHVIACLKYSHSVLSFYSGIDLLSYPFIWAHSDNTAHHRLLRNMGVKLLLGICLHEYPLNASATRCVLNESSMGSNLFLWSRWWPFAEFSLCFVVVRDVGFCFVNLFTTFLFPETEPLPTVVIRKSLLFARWTFIPLNMERLRYSGFQSRVWAATLRHYTGLC